MKFNLLIIAISVLSHLALAQISPGDSLLVNERAIDRPLTLHAGQLRLTGAYGLTLLSRRYDLYGEAISLADEGVSSTKHRFLFDIKYGVNDFIQVNIANAYSGNVVRQRTQYIVPMEPDPVVSHDIVTNHAGIEDLYLGVDIRAPLKTRKVDVAVTLGARLPTASFEPSAPEHSFESTRRDGDLYHNFTYRYNYTRGQGITVARAGTMIKYRLTKFAFTARVDYEHGLTDGKSFEWRHQLNDDGTFEYRKDPFTYRLPDTFLYFAEIEYQPVPRLVVFAGPYGHTAFRGWTSSEEDLKVAVPYQSSWMISSGAEILINRRLWVRERITFPVAARSYDAPLSFETSVMYNIFPFKTVRPE